MLSKLANSRSAFAITPGAAELPVQPNGLYIGGTGDLSVKFDDAGATVVFKAVPAGTQLRISPTHVLGASTATDIVGL